MSALAMDRADFRCFGGGGGRRKRERKDEKDCVKSI